LGVISLERNGLLVVEFKRRKRPSDLASSGISFMATAMNDIVERLRLAEADLALARCSV
jgi:hypothetical protein